MPKLLSRLQAQNETWMRKLPPSSTRFRGTLFPINPTALPTSVFILPRIGMRCRPKEPVWPRDLFRDPGGRILLVGEHDVDPVSRTYALFQMTELVSWERRAAGTVNPVTKQETSVGPFQELGPIWISLESYTRGNEDPGVRIPTDRLRVITGALIKLGDMVADKTVKRVNETLGVTVAEVE